MLLRDMQAVRRLRSTERLREYGPAATLSRLSLVTCRFVTSPVRHQATVTVTRHRMRGRRNRQPCLSLRPIVRGVELERDTRTGSADRRSHEASMGEQSRRASRTTVLIRDPSRVRPGDRWNESSTICRASRNIRGSGAGGVFEVAREERLTPARDCVARTHDRFPRPCWAAASSPAQDRSPDRRPRRLRTARHLGRPAGSRRGRHT